MLTKDKVRKTIDRLPENFTVDQIVEELVILYRIEEGLKDVEEGKSLKIVQTSTGFRGEENTVSLIFLRSSE